MSFPNQHSMDEVRQSLDAVGGEILTESGFEDEQPETDFDADDFSKTLPGEVEE